MPPAKIANMAKRNHRSHYWSALPVGYFWSLYIHNKLLAALPFVTTWSDHRHNTSKCGFLPSSVAALLTRLKPEESLTNAYNAHYSMIAAVADCRYWLLLYPTHAGAAFGAISQFLWISSKKKQTVAARLFSGGILRQILALVVAASPVIKWYGHSLRRGVGSSQSQMRCPAQNAVSRATQLTIGAWSCAKSANDVSFLTRAVILPAAPPHINFKRFAYVIRIAKKVVTATIMLIEPVAMYTIVLF